MGRRFALATQTAFAGTLLGALWGWLSVRLIPFVRPDTVFLAVGIPSIATVLLLLLLTLIPSLLPGDSVERPMTFAIPLMHVALTALVARAIYTQPTVVAAAYESLTGVVVWMQLVNLGVLGAGQIVILEVAVLLRRRGSA